MTTPRNQPSINVPAPFWGGQADVIPAQEFVPTAINTADHDFMANDGVRPRALFVNNSGTTLQTLTVRGENDSVDAPFICGPGGTLLPISPRYIRMHTTLTVNALR